MGLMVVMFVVGAAAAPGYYMFRGGGNTRDSWLIGMLMMLAGPLLIMTIISVVLRLTSRGRSED
jgi:Na+-driven multidrug efflux pump